MTSLTVAERLGIEPLATAVPVELRPNWTEDDIRDVIRAAYRQVLGNDHLMQSERLISAESLLRQGQITVREFVRAIALSELYRQKFFHSNQQTRFIELNYKHLLGRAPYDESEIAYHVNLYIQQGYTAEINSYIESSEYQIHFGEAVVPYYRGFSSQLGQKTVAYNRMFQLYKGYATSDRAQAAGNRAQLTRDLGQNLATPIPVRGVVSSPTITDFNQLLAQVLQPRVPDPTLTPTARYGVDYELLRRFQEQAAQIQTLQQQLAELKSFAAVGSAWSNKWQTLVGPAPQPAKSRTGFPHSSQVDITHASAVPWELQQQVEAQANQITTLQQQIAENRSLAAIGEARLNRWRSRTFSR
jgi:phycocyanin-associated rod linker protein